MRSSGTDDAAYTSTLPRDGPSYGTDFIFDMNPPFIRWLATLHQRQPKIAKSFILFFPGRYIVTRASGADQAVNNEEGCPPRTRATIEVR